MLSGKCEKACKHIIWDWNGTLLDDVNIVVDAMNNMLKRRRMALINMEKYRQVFAFPVRDYYAQLGFDFGKEPFEELATEFTTEFNSDKYGFKLHGGVIEVLEYIRNMGIGQSILSASKEQELNEIILQLGIKEFFVKVAGLDNHYASSKVERGKELLADLNLDPHDVLLVGDTVHDYEVSRELGCDCLLVCNGHQNHARLQECNVNIVNDMTGINEYLEWLLHNSDS